MNNNKIDLGRHHLRKGGTGSIIPHKVSRHHLCRPQKVQILLLVCIPSTLGGPFMDIRPHVGYRLCMDASTGQQSDPKHPTVSAGPAHLAIRLLFSQGDS